ncbi:MAG: PAS domain S-box protein [Methanomassiliicoccales archaeon]|jgi:PAS domain S-box-containing protein
MIQVLYVDDEPALCSLTKIFLEMPGEMEVDTAFSVRDANKALSKKRYDAIVSDYQMPGEDGIQFLKSLRTMGDKTPFILFTGRGREEVVIEALNSGADSYLQKGNDPESQYVELGHRIRSLVGRHQAEEALRRKTEELDRYFTLSLDLLCIADTDGYFRRLNPEWERTLGYSLEELIGTRFLDLVDPDDVDMTINAVTELSSQSTVLNFVNRYRCKDGSYRWIEWRSYPEGKMIYAVARDITERKRAQEDLARANRMLRMLNDTNRALIHDTDEATLMNDVCRIIIDLGGYRLAWIGFKEQDEAKTVRPVAYAGFDSEYIKSANVTWADSARGRGPGGTAIRTGQVSIIRNISEDPAFAPWREDAIFHGYQSVIVLPLTREGETFGVLGIYSCEADAFDLGEVDILMELANDLAYGIIALRTRIDHEKAEEALRELSAYNRSLIEVSIDPFVTIGCDGKIQDVNNAIEIVTGIPRIELIGTDFSDYFMEPEKAREGYRLVFSQGKVLDYPLEILHRNGHSTPVLFNATILYDSYGNIKGVFAAARDITESKRAEMALRSSEERLRSTMDNMIEGCQIMGHDWRCLYVNDAAERQNRRPKEEMLGKTIYESFPGIESTAPALYAAFKRCLEDRVPVEIENEYRYPNESKGWFDVRMSPVSEGIFILTMDITERKRIEEELIASKDKMVMSMDLAKLAHWDYDVLRDRFYFDERFYALYGTTVEKEGGHHMTAEQYVSSFVPAEEVEAVSKYIEHIYSTANTSTYSQIEHSIRRRDGEIRQIIVRIHIIRDENGQSLRAHGVNQDITEWKIVEEALKHTNRQLNLLTGITRHDMTNQLTVLSGYAQLLGTPEEEVDQQELLKKMNRSISMLQSQLEFTKQYQEIGVNAPAWQNLHEQILEAKKHLPLGALEVNEEGTDVQVLADPMLEKVVFNLIDNILRHGGGAKHLTIRAEEREGRLDITFEDDGVGISDRDRPHLFERGYGKSSGFGLFMSREILSITNMTITETSDKGKGARFEIKVPPGTYRSVANG